MILTLFFLYAAFQHTTATSTCLKILDGSKCAKIQSLGHDLADRVKEIDNIVQEVLFRAVDEVNSIIKPSVEYLQQEALKVKIANPVQTPIETPALKLVEEKVVKIVVTSVREANEKVWLLIRKISLLKFKDEEIAKALFFHKINKRTASMNSLNGIVDSVSDEIKNILTTVDTNLKKESAFGFQLFADSLKQLLQGKTGIDFDQTKSNLEKLLSSTMSVTVGSLLEHGKVALTEATRCLENIYSIISHLQNDPQNLRQALLPASELVMEQVEKVLSKDDDEELKKKIISLINTMRNTFLEVKKTVST